MIFTALFIIFDEFFSRWLYKLQKNDNHETNNEKIPEEFSLMSQSMTELKEISRI